MRPFNSASLHRHVSQTYKFDAFSPGYVEILAAQQTLAGLDWYQGTADAVRQNLRYFQQPGLDEVLILSGDQLYHMDFQEIIARHRATQADITVAVLPVDRSSARNLGILQTDAPGRIVRFHEKPATDELLDELAVEEAVIAQAGLTPGGRQHLASMGIYVFNRDRLQEILESSPATDFGKEILPAALHTHRVTAFFFDGYWEDIGTISSFHQANLELVLAHPPFEFYQPQRPVYTRPRFLPGAKIQDCRLQESLICDGCLVEEATIRRSIVGLRSIVGPGVQLKETVLMGADFYETEAQREHPPQPGVPPLGIGAGSRIRRAIIDKNARIGRGVVLENQAGKTHFDGAQVFIRDGILIVPRNGVVPDGAVV